jgi:beta-phosphoglucomutase family hydrolase
MPAPIAALVFDMDGTLVDNMRYHEQAWIAFFKRRGQDIDPPTFFAQTAGRHNREIMHDWISPSLTQEELAALAEEKESLYRQLYAPHRKAVAGFTAFAAQARAAQLKLAVATSSPPVNVAFILDALELRTYFDVVVDASNVQRGKPHPDIYLAAAQQLGVQPSQCIAFEDAPAGVESANAAGMPCVALTTYLDVKAFAKHTNVLACVADFTQLNLKTLLGSNAS